MIRQVYRSIATLYNKRKANPATGMGLHNQRRKALGWDYNLPEELKNR